MALNPYELNKLTEAEAKLADAMEDHVDTVISEKIAIDPLEKAFHFKLKDIAKVVGQPSIKVRENVLDRYRNMKWKVEIDDEGVNMVLTIPSKRGRKAGTKNKPKGEAPAAPAEQVETASA